MNGLDSVMAVSANAMLAIMIVMDHRITLNQRDVVCFTKSSSGMDADNTKKKMTSVQKPVSEYAENKTTGR